MDSPREDNPLLKKDTDYRPSTVSINEPWKNLGELTLIENIDTSVLLQKLMFRNIMKLPYTNFPGKGEDYSDCLLAISLTSKTLNQFVINHTKMGGLANDFNTHQDGWMQPFYSYGKLHSSFSFKDVCSYISSVPIIGLGGTMGGICAGAAVEKCFLYCPPDLTLPFSLSFLAGAASAGILSVAMAYSPVKKYCCWGDDVNKGWYITTNSAVSGLSAVIAVYVLSFFINPSNTMSNNILMGAFFGLAFGVADSMGSLIILSALVAGLGYVVDEYNKSLSETTNFTEGKNTVRQHSLSIFSGTSSYLDKGSDSDSEEAIHITINHG